jgi:hypothetical protein
MYTENAKIQTSVKERKRFNTIFAGPQRIKKFRISSHQSAVRRFSSSAHANFLHEPLLKNKKTAETWIVHNF